MILYQALPYTRAADLPGAPEPFLQVAVVNTLLQQRESLRAVRQFTQADRLLQVGSVSMPHQVCAISWQSGGGGQGCGVALRIRAELEAWRMDLGVRARAVETR
jgi:hypothetical protein